MSTTSRTVASTVLRCAALALLLVGAVLVAAAGWIAYAHGARAARETKSVEQLAGGQGRWVPAGDAALYVQEWGEAKAPTLLLLHGTGAWSGTWFGLPRTLSEAGWRVVAVDLPPFGLSKPALTGAGPDYSRAAQARRVLGLIDSLGAPVVLVGHSFGAGPALEAALQAQGRVRQLVLVDPALGLGPMGEAPVCEAGGPGLLAHRDLRTALVGATATWPGLTGTLLKQFVFRKDAVTDALVPAYRVPFERQGFTASLGDWAQAFAVSACENAASLDPAKLRGWAAGGLPVALLWGEQDSITPLPQARALQGWIPQATLTVLPQVGHIPHIESPEAFADALLGRLPSAAAP
jgi:pimeloyl-ACP methyl ester carboxylesterase